MKTNARIIGLPSRQAMSLGLLAVGIASLAASVAVHCFMLPTQCSAAMTTLWIAAAASGVMGVFLTSSGLLLLRRQEEATPEVRIFDSPDAIPRADWLSLVPADRPYLQLDFLQGERDAANGTRHRYAIAYRDGEPIAGSCHQLVEVGVDSLGTDALRWQWPTRAFVRALGAGRDGNVRVLVGGSVLHTRAGALVCAPDLDEERAAKTYLAMTETLRRKEPGIAITVLKDVPLEASAHKHLHAAGFHDVPGVQPTMTIPVSSDWQTFDDYLDAMSAKYRKRARVAQVAGAALRRQVLSAAQIDANAERMQRLVDGLIDRADFKLAAMSVAQVAALKRRLGERFVVTAYHLGEDLVAFSAALLHQGSLEALLVGFDDARNRELALYQNILYDFVGLAIARDGHEVHLGRTALEIKSTLGAEPRTLPVHVRHNNPVLNTLLGFVLRFVPPVRWTQRRPFKATTL